MSKMKFFAGCEAGCIGHTNGGYPIRDYQLVLVKRNDAEGALVFQIREVRGVVGEDGAFCVAKPECRSTSLCSDDEPSYEMRYWLNKTIVPNEELVTRYEAVNVTDIVRAIAMFTLEHPETDSPYFAKKCWNVPCDVAHQLDARKKKDRAIINAVKAALEG